MYLIEALSSLNGQIPQCLREKLEELPEEVRVRTIITHIGRCGDGSGYVVNVISGPLVSHGNKNGVLICVENQNCCKSKRCRQIPSGYAGIDIRLAGGSDGGSIAYPCCKLDYEEWVPEPTM